jgi:superfamily II DNA or RNA helicase
MTARQAAQGQIARFAKQLTWGAPTEADRQSLRHLLSDLKNKTLQVRLFTERPLHAKLYLAGTFEPQNPGRAIVGSSNFTTAGLSKNGELNLEETDHQKVSELGAWFEEHWENDFSWEITQDLIDVLEASWAVEPQPDPYLLHLKMAYELSRDARSGKSLSIPENIQSDLVPWQVDAVRIATRIAKVRGLAVVGDVVGLGKTLVGVGIAGSLGESVLVLCPPNLKSMWSETLEHYELPHKVLGLSQPLVKDLPNLRTYKVVIIDEAHNLRHDSTKIWPEVKKYISENNSRLILLTATMFNADVMDIAGQLELKLDPDDDLGIQPEKHIEALSESELRDFRIDLNHQTTTLKAFKRSEEADDWRRLLSLFLVRRTRAYLLERYALTDDQGNKFFRFNDGTEFRFPDRVQEPLEYPGGPNDPCDQLASVANFEILDQLTYARYQIGRYLNEAAVANSENEEKLIEDLRRATASAGFIRTTILKRLTSSPKAFFITVEKMLLRTHLLRWAAENDMDLPVGDLLDKHYGFSDESDSRDEFEEIEGKFSASETEYLDGTWAKDVTKAVWNEKAKSAYFNLLENSPRKLRWARLELFNKAKLMLDLESDTEDLQSIINTHGAWDANQDTKLLALANRIRELPPEKKLLVFSEYADSIDYVHRHLVRLLPNVAIEKVSGKTADPTTIARRFAPESNRVLGGMPKDEKPIQVLLATDVLSEGQNLQDCDQVLNWDIPWTIIKIIQRAGRVDRIGQKSKSIKILTFKPHAGLDGVLSLVSRLRNRLKENHEIFGGAENFFNDPLIDNPSSFFDGDGANLPDIETEVDFSSYALQIWDSADEADRIKARRIGDASFTTISGIARQLSGGVLAHAIAERADETIIDYIAYQTAAGESQAKTPMEALKLTSTPNHSAPGELLENHLQIVEHLLQNRFVNLARSERTQGYVGMRGRLRTFLEACQSNLGISSTGHVRAVKLETELSSRGVRSSAKSDLIDLFRSTKKSGDFDSAVDLLWDMNLDGLLLTNAPTEVKSLKISTSFGWNY